MTLRATVVRSASGYNFSRGSLRHADLRTDWVAGEVKPRRRRRKQERPFSRSFFFLLLFLAFLGWWLEWRRGYFLRLTEKEGLIAETRLELAVIARLVKDFHTVKGRYPHDFHAFLIGNLRHNKKFPTGCDFWGHAYVLEPQPARFVVRSAGPDGRYRTPDDLTRKASIQRG